MKIAIIGREKEKAKKLFLKHRGTFTLVNKDPDIVVSFGGDGTLMEAERLFPGVPKLYLKNSRVGKLSNGKTNVEAVSAVVKGKYRTEEYFKLEAKAKGKTLTGLNDIIIHNKDPRHAIRYRIMVDGRPWGNEIIGDGIVIATPLGSTGYYRSITDSYFEEGIGLAFNNSTEQSDHVVLKKDRVIKMDIIRGPAVCYADNQKEYLELKGGDSIRVEKSSKTARIIRL